jgi:prepilin-type processing-associated H-X9-DG protein
MIGLIAILLAMLLPALSSARRRAGSVGCISNLHQWAIAVNQYALEYHNYLPRRGQGQQPTTVINRPEDWFNGLPTVLRVATYLDLVSRGQIPRAENRGLWICPQATETPNTSGYLFTYAMNMRLSTWQAAQPDRIETVGSPSTMVFMTDAPGGYCSVLPFNAAYSPIARHDRYVNIAFLDGHAASFPGSYVGCGAGDPQRSDVRWIVPGSAWLGPVQ